MLGDLGGLELDLVVILLLLGLKVAKVGLALLKLLLEADEVVEHVLVLVGDHAGEAGAVGQILVGGRGEDDGERRGAGRAVGRENATPHGIGVGVEAGLGGDERLADGADPVAGAEELVAHGPELAAGGLEVLLGDGQALLSLDSVDLVVVEIGPVLADAVVDAVEAAPEGAMAARGLARGGQSDSSQEAQNEDRSDPMAHGLIRPP